MSEPSGDPASGDASDAAQPTSSARPDVFGDVLPDQTGDDLLDGSDWREGEDDEDERLRREVPPHH